MGSFLPHYRGKRPGSTFEVDPQRRRDDELRSSQTRIDHVCIQNWNVKRTAALAQRNWGKPIVNDELEYEGDISLAWGNHRPQELAPSILGHCRGAATRGTASVTRIRRMLWWAKGGTLHGESWKRVAFLRSIIEEDVEMGLTPASTTNGPGATSPWRAKATTNSSTLASTSPRLWFRPPELTTSLARSTSMDTWDMKIAAGQAHSASGVSKTAAARRRSERPEAAGHVRGRVAGQSPIRRSASDRRAQGAG